MLIIATMIADNTRTLLFGVFVLAGQKLTATEVIELARPLGISATNVKSHLSRMVEDGALKSAGPVRRGRYWPSEAQAMVMKGIMERLYENNSDTWDGTWLMLTLRMPVNRTQRERFKASLWFDGFRPCTLSTFVRPAWPRRWALSRVQLHLARAPGLCICGLPVGSLDLKGVRTMYRLDVLDREAHRLARRISKSQVSMHSAADAFVTRLKVGGSVARLVGHDPRLPRVVWGKRTGMRVLLSAFRRFEARIAPVSQRFLDEIIR
jgi:phenylacetic acid degradation operon negative regulatory protein